MLFRDIKHYSDLLYQGNSVMEEWIQKESRDHFILLERQVINMILETERLYLRKMNQADFRSLCKILQDEETMYAYEGAFSDSEVQE